MVERQINTSIISINNELKNRMENSLEYVQGKVTKENLSYLDASFQIGIAKVVETVELRGFI